jgi:lipid-A-disaccharide synthase
MQILVSVLEESANIHLGKILKFDKNRELEIIGLFDERFGNPIVSSKKFNVMGIFSIFPKIKIAKDSIKKLVDSAKNIQKVLLIDSPAFNLPLAKALKEKYPNIKIYFYILPKIWAWNRNRIKIIEKYIDCQISIFPFEQEFYKNSIYFGNPSIEDIPETFKTLGDKIAFLPGSRENEIRHHMPIFRELAKTIDKNKIILIPKNLENKLEIYGNLSQFEIRFGSIFDILKESSFAFVCSGTATLETALSGVPFVLLYKMNPIEFWIAKKFVKLKNVGLANIIFENNSNKDLFHKEFLQKFEIEDLLKEMNLSKQNEFYLKSLELRKILKEDNPSYKIFELLKKQI